MRALSAILFCLAMVSLLSAQRPVQIGEFSNIPCDQYLAQIDVALARGRQEPAASLYFLIYEGYSKYYDAKLKLDVVDRPIAGSEEAKIRSVKKYMRVRGFPIDRAQFAKGGFRARPTVEIWLVPPGAELPKPDPTVGNLQYRKGRPFGFCTDCCGP